MQATKTEAQPKKRKYRGAHVQFEMKPAYWKRIQEIADSEGLTASSWVRSAVIRELRRRKAA